MWLFLILVAVPIIEIGLFIEVGGMLGLWPTLGIVVLTALIGTMLMRAQGISTLQRLQSNIEAGKNPTDPIAHGAFILVAGLLLLTPGFFTDTIGLLLLVPPVRKTLIAAISARIMSGNASFATSYKTYSQNTNSPPTSSTIVEGEYEVEDDDPDKTPGNSGWTQK